VVHGGETPHLVVLDPSSNSAYTSEIKLPTGENTISGLAYWSSEGAILITFGQSTGINEKRVADHCVAVDFRSGGNLGETRKASRRVFKFRCH